MVQQKRRALGEGTRIAQEGLLSGISMISADDGFEGVPSKSSTSSSTWVIFGLDEDAIGNQCVRVNGARMSVGDGSPAEGGG